METQKSVFELFGTSAKPKGRPKGSKKIKDQELGHSGQVSAEELGPKIIQGRKLSKRVKETQQVQELKLKRILAKSRNFEVQKKKGNIVTYVSELGFICQVIRGTQQGVTLLRPGVTGEKIRKLIN